MDVARFILNLGLLATGFMWGAWVYEWTIKRKVNRVIDLVSPDEREKAISGFTHFKFPHDRGGR